PDLVLAVERLAGRGSDLADDHEAGAVALDRDEQQEIGEAEVGQQAPGRDQPLQMIERRALEAGVDTSQLGQRRHMLQLYGDGPPDQFQMARPRSSSPARS